MTKHFAILFLLAVVWESFGSLAEAQWRPFAQQAPKSGPGSGQGYYGSDNPNNGGGGRNSAPQFDWGGLLEGGLRALTPPPDNRSWEDRPQYRPPRYSEPRYQEPRYSQPRYQEPQYVAPRPAPVKPKTNKKAPEKVVKARGNAKADLKLPAMTALEYNLSQQIVQAQAEAEVADLRKNVGDATNDPQVDQALKDIEAKVAAGEPVTDKDMDKLKGLIDNAVNLPNTHTTNILPADFDKQGGKLIGLSEANAALSTPFPPGGFDPTFPSGNADVVLMPSMPEDEMCMLPGGAVMMGTGGEGAISVESANMAELLGLPVGVGEPVPESDEEVAKRIKSGVLLLNPEENGVPIEYVVANQNYSMQPGYSQVLPDGQTWVISFDRGAGQGEAKYSLASGAFAFGSSDQGWELFSRKFKVTLDNSQGDEAFVYVVDNAHAEVAAGQTKEHTSNYPILIRFDRGDGGQEAKKRVNDNSTKLVVAVDPDDGLWELFPAGNFAETGLAKQPEQPRKKKLGRAAALLKERSDR